MTSRRGARIAITLLALGGAVALLALLIARSETLPSGVRPVVWDRTSCAECRMAVSERAFAAQLQIDDGRVLDFDDPGCLFLYLESAEASPHALYFHHVREDRWLKAPDVAFVTARPSPMAFEFGAVDLGTDGAFGMDAARARALSRVGNERGKGAREP